MTTKYAKMAMATRSTATSVNTSALDRSGVAMIDPADIRIEGVELRGLGAAKRWLDEADRWLAPEE